MIAFRIFIVMGSADVRVFDLDNIEAKHLSDGQEFHQKLARGNALPVGLRVFQNCFFRLGIGRLLFPRNFGEK